MYPVAALGAAQVAERLERRLAGVPQLGLEVALKHQAALERRLCLRWGRVGKGAHQLRACGLAGLKFWLPPYLCKLQLADAERSSRS